MTATLSDFVQAGDDNFSQIDYPLFRAMAAGTEELGVTPEQFLLVMRYGVTSNLYYYVMNADGTNYHMVLGMKLRVI